MLNVFLYFSCRDRRSVKSGETSTEPWQVRVFQATERLKIYPARWTTEPAFVS